MPICTAILAAALLSGSAPADPVPAGNANIAPGKQIANVAMKHPEEPELIADKALQLLKGKGTKISPESQSSQSQPQSRPQSEPQSEEQSRPQSEEKSEPQSEEKSGPQSDNPMSDDSMSGNPMGPVIQRRPSKEDGESGGSNPQDVFLTGGNAPQGAKGQVQGQPQGQAKPMSLPGVGGQQFADSFSWPIKAKKQSAAAAPAKSKAKSKSKGKGKAKDAGADEMAQDYDWMPADWR
ncbi:hypothetical protein [Microbispora sp. NPDC049125]|uniref:hypothetical protein n=1 Tax=Microbispora sp. NPDC049125 TaxID=3154929 RepID=UPI0034666B6D